MRRLDCSLEDILYVQRQLPEAAAKLASNSAPPEWKATQFSEVAKRLRKRPEGVPAGIAAIDPVVLEAAIVGMENLLCELETYCESMFDGSFFRSGSRDGIKKLKVALDVLIKLQTWQDRGMNQNGGNNESFNHAKTAVS